MGFLEAIFSGVKAFVREIVSVASEAVRIVLGEVDRSNIGRAATQLVQGATKKYFKSAADLALEERDLAAKYQKDRSRSEVDEERLRQITAERDRLKIDLDAARNANALERLRTEKNDLISAPITDDEVSATVGLLASKTCSCGDTMRIRQGALNQGTGRRSFFWQCTSATRSCPTIKLDPYEKPASLVRKEDPNLDLDVVERRAIWQRKDVLVETAGRVRQSLGEDDDDIVCPTHLLPMKLLQKNQADGLLLSSYEYVCLGVNSEGRACQHRVALETYPQVSEALRRRDGFGIIRH